jgi:hypothetical protein
MNSEFRNGSLAWGYDFGTAASGSDLEQSLRGGKPVKGFKTAKAGANKIWASIQGLSESFRRPLAAAL